ncbi:hypothetical protein BJ165DRAFT_922879 [Panaeolus papilionaceus]|nr:hypothetical protein BJ165DRAFT_922879 [Panaeolus papilionaceus]
MHSDFITVAPPIPARPKNTCTDVKSAMEQTSQDLDYIEQLTGCLSALLTHVQERKKELEEHLLWLHQAHKVPAATTINDLPTEVLASIFWQYLKTPKPFKEYRPTFLNIDERPWILSWVCRYWRETILNDQRVWNVIPQMNFRCSDYFTHHDLSILQQYISRSHTHTLSLELHSNPNNTKDFPYAIVPYLFQHPERLKELHLVVDFDHLQGLLQKYPAVLYLPKGLESLTTLSLSLGFYSWSFEAHEYGTKFPSFLHSLPVLKELFLIAPVFQHVASFPAPWEQLTFLNITTTSTEQDFWTAHDLDSLYKILSQTIHLRSLLLAESSPYPGHSSDDEMHDAPPRFANTMVSLGIEVFHLTAGSMTTVSILSSLILPDLVKLKVVVRETTLKPLQALLSRSGCSPTACYLEPRVDENPHEGPPLLTKVLQLIPRTRKLVLNGTTRDDTFSILSRPHNGTWLVPQLECLVIALTEVSDPNIIEEFVQNRGSTSPEFYGKVTPIQEIHLRGSMKLESVQPYLDPDYVTTSITPTGGHSFILYQKLEGYTLIRLNETTGYEVNIHALESLCNGVEANRTWPSPQFPQVYINGSMAQVRFISLCFDCRCPCVSHSRVILFWSW